MAPGVVPETRGIGCWGSKARPSAAKKGKAAKADMKKKQSRRAPPGSLEINDRAEVPPAGAVRQLG